MLPVLNACRKGTCLLLFGLFFSCLISFTRTSDSPAYSPGGIDPLCWGDWQNYKLAIIRKRDTLKGFFEVKERMLITTFHNGQVDRDSVVDVYSLGHRIAILNAILENLQLLENSRQTTYALQFIDSPNISQTVYDFKHDKIVFYIAKWDTGNFIHESTHGIQFEKGGIVYPKHPDSLTRFSDTTTAGIGDDYDDEIAAYVAEFAYDPVSVAGLPSATSKVHSFEDISALWLIGLSSVGIEPYRFGAGIAMSPVTVNSSIKALQDAYPLSRHWTRYDGSEQPLKSKSYLYKTYRP